MPDSTVLGRNYPRVDAADKVSWRSQYASDIYLPGMLICKVLKSPKAHARILHIDTSRAQQLPGVRAVITGRDVPEARFGNGRARELRERHDFDAQRLEQRLQLLQFAGIAGGENDTHARRR